MSASVEYGLARNTPRSGRSRFPNLDQARSQNQLDWRPPIPDGASQFKPIHRTREMDVGEDYPNVLASFQNGNCALGAHCFDGLEAGILNGGCRDHPHEGLILYHEHDAS